ncbi:hypothetical protein QFZ40_000437 [Arthrobacter pascens]|nr:hypothetical protein [Arthrobacter pascens]
MFTPGGSGVVRGYGADIGVIDSAGNFSSVTRG